jgi:LAS superfamily LD-carboxypeptidase LdcB
MVNMFFFLLNIAFISAVLDIISQIMYTNQIENTTKIWHKLRFPTDDRQKFSSSKTTRKAYFDLQLT